MVDRPILFSAPMVRALLAGRKTQTRRVLKNMPPAPAHDSLVHPPKHDAPYFDAYCGAKRNAANPRGMSGDWCWWTRDDRAGHGCKVPFIPGDRLWVREEYYQRGHWAPIAGAQTKGGKQKWAFVPADDVISFDPPATFRKGRHHADPATVAWHKRLGRFMPRWASRITLLVTDVRVERLQDCSEADAIAEGGYRGKASGRVADSQTAMCFGDYFHTARGWYRDLWDRINGPGAWEANPWVVAVTFDVVPGNIDQVPQ